MTIKMTKESRQLLRQTRKELDTDIRETTLQSKKNQREGLESQQWQLQCLSNRSHALHILHHLMRGKTLKEIDEKYGLRMNLQNRYWGLSFTLKNGSKWEKDYSWDSMIKASYPEFHEEVFLNEIVA